MFKIVSFLIVMALPAFMGCSTNSKPNDVKLRDTTIEKEITILGEFVRELMLTYHFVMLNTSEASPTRGSMQEILR